MAIPYIKVLTLDSEIDLASYSKALLNQLLPQLVVGSRTQFLGKY